MAKPDDKAWEKVQIVDAKKYRALLDVARAGKRLSAAVELYLKHSNSPICIGWDEMLDALSAAKTVGISL